MNYKNIYSAVSGQKRKACAYVRVSTGKPEINGKPGNAEKILV